MNLEELLDYDPQGDMKLKEDPFKGTELESYCYQHPGTKGVIGEKIIARELALACVKYASFSFSFSKRKNAGHDLILEILKTVTWLLELKFSVAEMINHIAIGKDWEILIWCEPVCPANKEYKLYWFTKGEFREALASNASGINHQQGGKDGKNDDYIIANVNNLPTGFLKPIDEKFFKFIEGQLP